MTTTEAFGREAELVIAYQTGAAPADRTAWLLGSSAEQKAIDVRIITQAGLVLCQFPDHHNKARFIEEVFDPLYRSNAAMRPADLAGGPA